MKPANSDAGRFGDMNINVLQKEIYAKEAKIKWSNIMESERLDKKLKLFNSFIINIFKIMKLLDIMLQQNLLKSIIYLHPGSPENFTTN